MNQSEEEMQSVVKLKPRVSPQDYHQGFVAGLRAAIHSIEQSLIRYEMTRPFEEGSPSGVIKITDTETWKAAIEDMQAERDLVRKHNLETP